MKSEQWEENQKKKEYLNGYIKAKRKEQRILDQIQQLRMDKMFPGIQYSDMPGGSNMSDLSDFVVKMEELMQELRQERLEAVNEYTKIYRDISLVEDEREQEVLTYRYLEGNCWEVICGLMELSWKQTHRIHAQALENFKKSSK